MPVAERMVGGGDTAAAVAEFCAQHGWLVPPVQVTFLAAGEYHENWTVRSAAAGPDADADADACVFRITRGSQLGLANQIEYEFAVLQALSASGVTPRPLRCRREVPAALGAGVLLMELLPGVPLDYRYHLDGAAAALAQVHQSPVPATAAAGVDLLAPADALAAVVAESGGLLAEAAQLGEHRHAAAGRRLRELHRDLRGRAAPARPLLAERCIVNTELNSHNFLHAGKVTYVVDWEKAMVGPRTLDLAHFLAPTTTRWRRGVTLSPAQRRRFLATYHDQLPRPPSLDELIAATAATEQVVLLRALSWCYMASAAYSAGSSASGRRPASAPRARVAAGRPSAAQRATQRRIDQYLNGIDGLLDQSVVAY